MLKVGNNTLVNLFQNGVISSFITALDLKSLS